MKTNANGKSLRWILGAAALLAFAAHVNFTFAADAAANAKPAFAFKSIDYFARWAQGTQHEFTPRGQEDLDKWSDMLTANVYTDAHDGDGLAKMANATLGNYKSHNAVIVKTDSVPRTASKPAEHLVVAVFGQPTYLEVAFNRFMIVDGVGCSFTYSHRIYGVKAGDTASAWLSANGPATEKELMSWQPPSLKSLGN
jgi:hypothetical protein